MLEKIKSFIERQKEHRKEIRIVKNKEIFDIFDRGMHLSEIDLYNEALEDLRECEKKLKMFDDMQKVLILMNIGGCYFSQGNFRKGEKYFDKAYKLGTQHRSGVLLNKGKSHLQACNFDMSMEDLRWQAKEWKSKMRWAITGKEKVQHGDEYVKYRDTIKHNEHHIKKALDAFSKLVKLEPKEPDAWYFFGISLELTNTNREAADSFEAVLRLNPKYHNETQHSALFERIKKKHDPVTVVELHEKGKHKKYKTDRGVSVRSKAEALIDNFYFHNNVKARYEPTLMLGDIEITPDWELRFGNTVVYHEHFGMDGERYNRIRESKIKLYEKHGKNLIITTKEDEYDIENVLKKKLAPHHSFEDTPR